MKAKFTNHQNLLFNWACKILKYFMLALLGFAIAYVISHVLGVGLIMQLLLSPILWTLISRVAVVIFCLFAIAMIYESWA